MNCKVCGNTSTKNTSVSFFRFPKENRKCRDWAERCNLLSLYEKHGPLRFYKSFRICSAHFEPRDIVFDGRKKRLLESALPALIITERPKEERLNDMKNFSHDELLNLKLTENLCRLCAKENKNLIDIYGWKGRILNLEGKLKYFPLMINRYDVLPLRVCHSCITKVNQFHDFITRCMKAESQLRIMLDTSCKLSDLSASRHGNITQETQMKTPNLESSTTVSISPELMPPFPENIENDYYDEMLENNYGNEDGGNCFCVQTSFVRQSQNQSEPSFVTTIQLPEHTNYVKQVDFNSSISFEHDYSNIISRHQLQLESKIQTDNDQDFIEGTKNACQMCFECPHSNVLAHLVQPATNGKLNCEACNKVFFSRLEFEEHSHADANYASRICGKKLNKVSSLEEHPSDSSCDDFSDLRSSQIYQEPDDKVPKKNFREREGHVLEKINPKSRKRRCQFCDRLFKTRQVCLAHEKSHTGETPYQCKQCGKKFRSRPSLRQHGSVHSDKRLYNCKECGMSFKRKDTLSNHFRIHTGERPFVCKVCGFAFKQRGDCIKHEKNHQKTSKAEVKDEKLNHNHQIRDVRSTGSVTVTIFAL